MYLCNTNKYQYKLTLNYFFNIKFFSDIFNFLGIKNLIIIELSLKMIQQLYLFL